MAVGEQVFGFFIPTVTLMGVGAHKEIGKQVKVLGGKKPFICTDKGITKAGITQKIVDLVKQDAGVDCVVFDQTVPNPTDTNVHDGLKLFQEKKCDLIISLGGGSSHDWARGSGLCRPMAATSGTTKAWTSPRKRCRLSSPSTPRPGPPVR